MASQENIDAIKNDFNKIQDSEICIFEYENEIQAVVILLEDGYYNLCAKNVFREEILFKNFEFIKTLKQQKILEAGIGTGHILKYLTKQEKYFEIIELNKELYEVFKNVCNIKQGNIFNFIDDVEDTIICLRLNTTFFKDSSEFKLFLKKFDKIKNKNNILNIECKNYDCLKSLKNVVYLDDTTYNGYCSIFFELKD
jgi:SAM-dependent methyltransferase